VGSKQGAQSVPCKDWLEPPEGLMLLSGLLTSGVIQEQPYWQEAGGLWDVCFLNTLCVLGAPYIVIYKICIYLFFIFFKKPYQLEVWEKIFTVRLFASWDGKVLPLEPNNRFLPTTDFNRNILYRWHRLNMMTANIQQWKYKRKRGFTIESF